jgi:hypothetical protein
MAKPYQGYPSWNSWNVSLWINNDYNLYSRAYNMVQEEGMHRAIIILTAYWRGTRTPDGGVFNKRSIALALEGMDEYV